MNINDLNPKEYEVVEPTASKPLNINDLSPDSYEEVTPLNVKDINPDTPEPKTGTFQGIAGGASSGATFGFDDEIYGGMKAIGSSLGIADDQTSIMDDSSSFTQNYRAGRDERRDYKDQLAKDSPIAYKGSEIAGAVGTGILTGGASMPAIGAEAAAYGLGESEADLTEGEVGDALIDTGIGAGIGLATAGMVKGGANVRKRWERPRNRCCW